MLRRDNSEREKWLKGCDKELKNMILKNLWTTMSKDNLPQGRRLLECKWFFKLKRDGTY